MRAQMPPLTIACPCGVEIEVPIAVDMELDMTDGRQRLAFDPDYSDLWAHAWTHDTDVNIDEYRPKTGGDQ